jgi:hypothetical protein
MDVFETLIPAKRGVLISGMEVHLSIPEIKTRRLLLPPFGIED